MNEFGFLGGLKRKIEQCTVDKEEFMTKESLNCDEKKSINRNNKSAKTLMTASLHVEPKPKWEIQK